MTFLLANRIAPDVTPQNIAPDGTLHSAASHLGLFCLPKDALYQEGTCLEHIQTSELLISLLSGQQSAFGKLVHEIRRSIHVGPVRNHGYRDSVIVTYGVGQGL